MKSKVIVASTLAALTAGGLVAAETHCAAPTSCTERPVAVETWSPDMPEHGNATHAPTAQIVETGGTVTEALPPYVEDTSAPLPHRWPRRPMTQAEDDGYLGATAPSPPSLDWMYQTTEPVRRPSLARARRAVAMQHSDEAWMYAPTGAQAADGHQS